MECAGDKLVRATTRGKKVNMCFVWKLSACLLKKKLDFGQFLLEGIDGIALACTREKRIKQLCKEWRNGLGEKFKPSLLSPRCTPGRSLCEVVTMVRLLVPIPSLCGKAQDLFVCFQQALCEKHTDMQWWKKVLTSFPQVNVKIQCCENIQLKVKVLNSKTQNGALTGKRFWF